MQITEFSNLFRTFRRSAFRLEALPKYTVDQEADRLSQYLAGQPLPTDPNNAWCELVRTGIEAGKKFTRVHVLPEPLTPYLRFEIDWGYLYNATAGEDIRLLLPTAPAELMRDAHSDYWIFDDEIVVAMDYDDQQRFVGPRNESAGLAAYTTLRDRLLDHAVPLQSYLAEARNRRQTP